MGVTKLVPASEVAGSETRQMAATEKCRQLAGLIKACSDGDRGAFRRLYDLSARYVFGIVLSITKDHEMASEVSQEAYVRVWKRARQFQQTGGNPMSWIGAIARNCAIDRLRAERARGFVHFTDEVPDISDEIDHASHTLDSLVINQLLTDLRPEYRKALLLSFFHGYTYVELASVLDVPVGTAKSWVRRGLSALKEALQ